MLKHLIVLFLIILCLIPISSASDVTPCPTCPIQTPHIVYVTVTVTVPVPQTLPPTPAPTPTPIPLPTPPIQEQNIITKFTGLSEYIIYGLLFLLLIGGVIFMKLKQRKKSKPQTKTPVIEAQKTKYDYLYEEEDEPQASIIKEEILPENPKKSKKPKKPVSLLDRDFEF